MTENNNEVAVLGGGCFWCVEAVYTEIKGVTAVNSGYSGGYAVNPTYYQVCDEKTGHAEVVQVEFDPDQITFPEILEVFFASHDPTTLNRQGADVGTRYRSVILYTSDAQKDQSVEFIKELDASGTEPGPVVTELAPFEVFYPCGSGASPLLSRAIPAACTAGLLLTPRSPSYVRSFPASFARSGNRVMYRQSLIYSIESTAPCHWQKGRNKKR